MVFRNAVSCFYGPVSGFSRTNTTFRECVVIGINPSKKISDVDYSGFFWGGG